MTSAGRHACGMVSLVMVASVAVAQTDRVMVGGRPAPGQTARLRLTQEMSVQVTPEGAPPPGMPPGGIKTTGRTVIKLRQDVGPLAADGRLQLDLTYEDLTQGMRMNDVPVPLPPQAVDAILGKTVTMWMGADDSINGRD